MRKKLSLKNSGMDSIPPEYFNLGIYLITPLLLGALGGYFLDKYVGHDHTFMMVGLIIGTIAVFYNLWRLVANSDEQAKRKKI